MGLYFKIFRQHACLLGWWRAHVRALYMLVCMPLDVRELPERNGCIIYFSWHMYMCIRFRVLLNEYAGEISEGLSNANDGVLIDYGWKLKTERCTVTRSKKKTNVAYRN